MAEGKITVLQVLGGLNVGGAESRIMDILRHIDRDKIQYAFLLHSEGPDVYEEEAKALGCPVYRAPRFKLYNIITYKKAMKKFFSEHPEIDIVQGHITSSAEIYLPIAKKSGVKATIAHTRSASVDKDLRGFLTLILTKHMDKKCDYMWACSTEAAIAMYGEKNYKQGLCRVIPNAIDIKKYSDNDSSKIETIKKEYDLEDKFVVGHVGRFDDVKNHVFLIDIFNEILRLKSNAVLLLVGEGEKMESVKQKAEKLGIADKVIFAGRRSNVKDYLWNMNVFVFPSKYEGLPGSVVEAQSCFLPCVLSDTITKDVAATSLIDYESLESSPKAWADKVLTHYEKESGIDKTDVVNKMCQKGFDVTAQVEMLKNLYEQMMESNS